MIRLINQSHFFSSSHKHLRRLLNSSTTNSPTTTTTTNTTAQAESPSNLTQPVVIILVAVTGSIGCICGIVGICCFMKRMLPDSNDGQQSANSEAAAIRFGEQLRGTSGGTPHGAPEEEIKQPMEFLPEDEDESESEFAPDFIPFQDDPDLELGHPEPPHDDEDFLRHILVSAGLLNLMDDYLECFKTYNIHTIDDLKNCAPIEFESWGFLQGHARALHKIVADMNGVEHQPYHPVEKRKESVEDKPKSRPQSPIYVDVFQPQAEPQIRKSSDSSNGEAGTTTGFGHQQRLESNVSVDSITSGTNMDVSLGGGYTKTDGRKSSAQR